jgi:hypothetical protein
MPTDLATLTAADFEPLLHERFRIAAGPAEPFEAELIEVSETGADGSSRPQFSVLFRGGPSPPLPQRIYAVEHEQLGRLDLFLVPRGPDATGERYEAVFA